MRIKLILENEAGLKKDRLWFLFDELSCAKVADLAYLIKKRLCISEGEISLSLDGFSLPLQECIKIVNNNDEITARFVPQAPPSSSETSSSESEYEFQQTKCIPSNVLSLAQKNKNEIPIQKTIAKKKKPVNTPSAVLKKVAQTIPKTSVQNVNILKKTAANVLVKTNATNKTSLSNNVSCKPSIKKIVTVRKVSSSSCDSSSSSCDEEDIKKVAVAKKKVPLNGKTHCVPAKKAAVISVNKKTVPSSKKIDRNQKDLSNDSSGSSSSDDEAEPVKKKPMLAKKVVMGNEHMKKAIPLSKLGVSKTTTKDSSTDSSDSSDSSDENTPQLKSNVAPSITKRNAASGRIVSNTKGGNSFITVRNSNRNNTVTKGSSSGSSDESSASSSDDGPEIIKRKVSLSNKIPDKQFLGDAKIISARTNNSIDKSNDKKKKMDKLNTSVNLVGMDNVINNSADSSAQSINAKKGTKIVDFQVSKVSKDKDIIASNDFSHKSNNSFTTPNHLDVTCNGNGVISRAKRFISKDVYKNKSQFIVSKSTVAIDNPDTELSKDKKSDDATCNSTDLNDSFVATAENVSGRIMRRRKRAKIRRENKKKHQLAQADIHGHGENQVEKQANLPERVDSSSNVQNGSADEINASNMKIVGNDFIPGDTTEEMLEKVAPVTDYSSFESLAAPPAVGSRIAYKILEMNTVLYTPEISQYKEALIKSFNEENNMLELEVCQDPRQCKDEGDLQIGGKFEMPEMVDEENQGSDAQTNPIVKWNDLLEPRLLV